MYDCIGEVLTWTEECRFSDILSSTERKDVIEDLYTSCSDLNCKRSYCLANSLASYLVEVRIDSRRQVVARTLSWAIHR